MAHANASPIDRFNEALRSLDDQLQELRDRVDHRRKRFETELRKRRTELETRLRKTPLYKRAESVRKDVEGRVEETRTQVYSLFGIASKSELEKINRKLNTISRKVNELAKEQVEV